MHPFKWGYCSTVEIKRNGLNMSLEATVFIFIRCKPKSSISFDYAILSLNIKVDLKQFRFLHVRNLYCRCTLLWAIW